MNGIVLLLIPMTPIPSPAVLDSITYPSITYPESDGQPMSDNTKQFRLIVMIKENLEILFAAMLDVFIAGDLLWYPVQGDNKTRLAPDVMVAFGRPKGDRGSYMQWKEQNIPPQVAFEILSPSNTQREMEEKRVFYEKYGVEEYYVYDPDRLRLTGWTRQNDCLIQVLTMEGWVSPLLGIRFTQQNGDLEIYRPDGQRFLSSVERDLLAQKAQMQAEHAQMQAEHAQMQAEHAQMQAEHAQMQAEEERSQRQAAEAELQALKARLQQLGIDPDTLAAS
jgi:Uma2 family endonuclease